MQFPLFHQESTLLTYRKLSEPPLELYTTDEQGIASVVRTNKPKAFITSREYLNYVSDKYEQGAYYFPPYTDETTFFLDFLSIAYRKDFQYEQQFSKTYESF